MFSKAIGSYSCLVAITGGLPRWVSRGEVKVGERSSGPRHYAAAVRLAACGEDALSRCGAVRRSTVVD